MGAAHCENEHFTYDITSKLKTKFLGNSVEVYPVGRWIITSVLFVINLHVLKGLCIWDNVLNLTHVIKFHITGLEWHLKSLVLFWIWCHHRQRLTIWYLAARGLTHLERWSWQTWQLETKLCYISSRVAGLGMNIDQHFPVVLLGNVAVPVIELLPHTIQVLLI
jgi:hypothetical protein